MEGGFANEQHSPVSMVMSLDFDKSQIYWELVSVVYNVPCVEEWSSGLEEGNLAGFTAKKSQELECPYKVSSFTFF